MYIRTQNYPCFVLTTLSTQLFVYYANFLRMYCLSYGLCSLFYAQE